MRRLFDTFRVCWYGDVSVSGRYTWPERSIAVTNRVAITRAKDGNVDAAVREAVRLAGGFNDIITSRSRVLIKPNQGRPMPRHSGAVTDGDVVEAVAGLVLERNPVSVIIGDGAIAGWDLPGFSTQEAFDASGVTAAARKLGVELRNLNADRWEEVTVPVLKAAVRTYASLSLKNMKGVMPGAEKRKSHRVGLDKAIVDLCSVVRPSYAIVDATVGAEGMGQYPEDAKAMGLIVAGSDAVYVDVVGAALMGVDPSRIMHLQYMAQREGKRAELDAVELVGEPLEAHRQVFTTGFEVFQSRFSEVAIVRGESACSGCTNELVSALSFVKKAGYGERLQGLTVVIGDAADVGGTGKVAALGKCAADYPSPSAFVGGCPPKEAEMVRVLAEACGADPAVVLATMAGARKTVWDASDPLMDR
jgi:uncharacterized protein (DUF362 family)